MAKLEQDGEFAEQLFVHGLGVQTAEGLSEWLHWKVRELVRHPRATQGRRLSWGYPAVPEQSEHDEGRPALLDISRSAWRSPTATRPTPEQSTLAMVVHHPQSVYYGMRNGRFLPTARRTRSSRAPSADATLVQADLLESDPVQGPIEDEALARRQTTPAS